ncbi:unnamed protein product [Alopecurus aequalis]
MATTPYFAAEEQGPVAFPVSGSPVCVSLGAPFWRGNMRPVHHEGTGATFIELTGSIVHATSPAEKFFLEPSQQHEGLVHIRCCGSNKYWVAEQHERDGTGGWFICGSADEPEEDLAKPSCTLFEFRQQPEEGIEGYNARSNGSDRFWRLRPEEGWICAESGDAIYKPQPEYKSKTVTEEFYADVNTLFRVVIKSDNHVALQSISNGKFCKSLTHDDKTEYFSACVDGSSTTSDVELQIEVPPVKVDDDVTDKKTA